MTAAARRAPELIPRRALITGGAVVLLTLVGTAAVCWSGTGSAAADSAVVAQRLLRFEDLPDRGIAIVDHASGQELEVVHGEQGFLRGTLRGLARERRLRGLTGSTPLQLLARADGRLTLADPSTGQHIDLESFGASNAAVFARWLQPQPLKRTPA